MKLKIWLQFLHNVTIDHCCLWNFDGTLTHIATLLQIAEVNGKQPILKVVIEVYVLDFAYKISTNRSSKNNKSDNEWQTHELSF